MSEEIEPIDSPIMSGWRGNLNGHIEKTNSEINVSEVTLKLDASTAYALANMLTEDRIDEGHWPKHQHEALMNLGAALGRLIDHRAANNGGRRIIK